MLAPEAVRFTVVPAQTVVALAVTDREGWVTRLWVMLAATSCAV